MYYYIIQISLLKIIKKDLRDLIFDPVVIISVLTTTKITLQHVIELFLPPVLIVELNDAAPVVRPLLETAEATEGVEDTGDEAAAVEETDDDVNRSPDSISKKETKVQFLQWEITSRLTTEVPALTVSQELYSGSFLQDLQVKSIPQSSQEPGTTAAVRNLRTAVESNITFESECSTVKSVTLIAVSSAQEKPCQSLGSASKP